ncbi:LOG family protein [Dongia sedimenti]|uniref:Cytokinin riboside 5'-monophosphate phosphoribohydrolase n=1 Tax=Dongia sedimenti TaxID=3064282 RepID=A0ABU0YEY8_9PROT|nr:TIGR00730 family Rossman fold protein [Rhodospirillaceae bacterium R-7]
MTLIRSLCVYCGSARGRSPRYVAAARELGEAMAERRIRLVYGGARIGMMGEVADAVMKNGGQVIGVIPEHLQTSEVGHSGITELKVVESMHVRKKLMFDLSDGFAVLPGGYGTLDELFEIITWRMLKLHDKPVVVLNIDGYWNAFEALIDQLIAEGFARPDSRQFFSVVNSVGRMFDLLEQPGDIQVTEHPERI